MMVYRFLVSILILLNISRPRPIHGRDEPAIISWREGSKKHALSLSEGSVQQGRSPFDERSVLGVREHGKMARTSLAVFFNIPIKKPGPGDPAAHRLVCLPLLPSGPGGVHKILLHRAQPLFCAISSTRIQ